MKKSRAVRDQLKEATRHDTAQNIKNWTGLRRAALLLTTALILTLCGGCSPATRIVVLTPPDSLLADCPQPKMPEALMQSRDWRAIPWPLHACWWNTARPWITVMRTRPGCASGVRP